MDALPPAMRALSVRPLTAGEIGLARGVFGDEIEYDAVRVAQVPKAGFGAMVPFGRTIVFSHWRARDDFSVAPLAEQGWFIHELAHVWQAHHGIVLALAKLGALGKKAYRYEACAGAHLKAYNIEAQAEIARHVFLARNGVVAPGMADEIWLEQIWSRRRER